MDYPPLSDLRLPALCTVVLYFIVTAFGAAVGQARRKFNVPYPSTNGPIEFNRVFRAHANTAEQYPLFLAVMWTCAIFFSGPFAGLVGAVWLACRIMYFNAYTSGQKFAKFAVPGYLSTMLLSGGVIVALFRSTG